VTLRSIKAVESRRKLRNSTSMQRGIEANGSRPEHRGATTANMLVVAAVAAGVVVLLLIFLLIPVIRNLRPDPPQLNVILISIDTLRPDRMGVYGHRPKGRSTTPFLDGLAAEGARFTRASSTSPWTLPGHYSLLSGTPDPVHGMVHDRASAPEHLPLLAEFLAGAGYRTAGFFSGPYLHALFGFGRGFDVYQPCMAEAQARKLMRKRQAAQAGGAGAQCEAPQTKFLSNELITSGEVTGRALHFVREHMAAPLKAQREGDIKQRQPFFLFLHYFDVHNDFLPPSPFDQLFGAPYDGWVNGRGITSDTRYNASMDSRDLSRLLALYDGEVAWVDHNLSLLWKGLEKIDPELLENTLVIITSDHGEEFFDHGKIGHRKNLYESVIRIPLIVYCPGHIARGVTIDEPVRIYDVFPTVSDVLGFETPDAVLGESLLALIEGERDTPRPALLNLTQLPKENRIELQNGLILGEWKLITKQARAWSSQQPFDFTGKVLLEEHELFHMDRDAAETRDLATERADITEKMQKALADYLEELNRSAAAIGRNEKAPASELPEHLRKSLNELGY